MKWPEGGNQYAAGATAELSGWNRSAKEFKP
jgi:hypothetical protein